MPDPFVHAFTALRPGPGRAAEVAAPPYDVVTTEEARALAETKPWSILHVSRPEIDLAPGSDPYGDEAYQKASEAMQRMIREGVLIRDASPAYYVYRMTARGHEQTGIAAAADVSAYESGRIRRHELTRPTKEIDRARQIEAVGAHTGPVLAAHKPNAALAAVLQHATAADPDADATVDDVRHRVWRIDAPQRIAEITAAFAGMDGIYVADGHHRSGAAVRVAEARRGSSTGGGRFLIVSFPADEVRILDYNRVVRDLGGLSPEAFLSAVRERFDVSPAATPLRPAARGAFGMVLGGQWYSLRPRSGVPSDTASAETLDVAVLARELLEPVLGIGDPRTDPRVDFVGGRRGLGELERLVASGEWAAAFSLFPTTMEDLMAVADRGEIMPPKSTWFEPKLADGLVSLPLD